MDRNKEPDTFEGEAWRPVVGHEEVYQVSNMERVWSNYRRVKRNFGGFHYIGGVHMHIHESNGRKFVSVRVKGVRSRTKKLYIDEILPAAFTEVNA